ncbi:rare lipoprotein A [Ancylobacter aquaticus]|uniref:Endolytic peptidoglycan transglycosylase RlpA n=1 Tax=Ancylobacter aquaticus TaxID=100 RepID=A0A4R1I103_ANCAQ|nr:septal ring lytic transglycosylase RlpA family protein [Ancylobacter aquaticus]TCK28408.1 rare lipoprotein A [Ancylobacter aquaticus]
MGKYPALANASGRHAADGAFVRFGRIAALCGIGLLVANCTGGGAKLTSKIDPKYGVSASPRVVAAGQPVPKGGGTYRVGKPYVVAGKTYVPTEPTKKYRTEGLASWYGDDFHGRLTANGEVFDMHSIAAAHPTLPMPSYVRVTNLSNNRSMVVRVNDRGPFHGNRVIDVSHRAADMLGFKSNGTARVRVDYIGKAPLEGSDDIQLASTLRMNGKPAEAPAVMVASAGSLRGLTAANVPLPPSRPFDLGGPGDGQQVAQAAYSEPVAVQIAPVRVTSKPRPAAVAAALPAPRPQTPSTKRAKATIPAPTGGVQVASLQPATRTAAAPAAGAPTGWMVGAQPVMGYAPSGTEGSPDMGRGLY